MALAYQCDTCGTNWPNTRNFAVCPRCRERCRTAVCANPLTNGDAQIMLRNIDFERHYSQHEEKRERLGHPSPEELGRKEAFALIKAWHEARTALERE